MKKTSLFYYILWTSLIWILTIVLFFFIYQKEKQQETIILNSYLKNTMTTMRTYYPDVSEEEWLNNLKNIQNQDNDWLNSYGIKTNLLIPALDKWQHQKVYLYLFLSFIPILLFTIFFIIYYRKRNHQLDEIINYLEDLNKGLYHLDITSNAEEKLSRLQNQIYKITIMLREKSEQSVKEKENLAKSLEDISHQLKTPLTSIQILLANLQETQNEEEKNKFLHQLQFQIDWIQNLVTLLLKCSRFDAKAVVLKNEPFTLDKLYQDTLKQVEIILDLKNISLVIKGDNLTINGDYFWFKEAFINLLKNAIEHSKEGSKIEIIASENYFSWFIEIIDEGEGMTKKDCQHIFERFYRGSNATKESIGIGLSLAEAIIDEHGFNLTCFSKLHEGTTFKIENFK